MAEGTDNERAKLLGTNSPDSDDEFVLRGKQSRSSETSKANVKIQEVQLQVEEITSVMKENINKLFARGDRLEDLNQRSENLSSASGDFRSAASRLHKNMWWKHRKFMLIVGVIVLLLMIALIVFLVVHFQ